MIHGPKETVKRYWSPTEIDRKRNVEWAEVALLCLVVLAVVLGVVCLTT